MSINNNLFSSFSNISTVQKTNIQSPNVSKNKNNILVNGSIVTANVIAGSFIGKKLYDSDNVQLKDSLNELKSVFLNSKIKNLMGEFNENFASLTKKQKVGEKVSLPNCLMLVGKDSKVNDTLIKGTAENSVCDFVKLSHPEKGNSSEFILKLKTAIKKAAQDFNEKGTHTLINVDNFEELINPKLTNTANIASLKGIMDCCSDDYHSTIIFSAKDPSVLDPSAIQVARVAHQFNVDVTYDEFDKASGPIKKIEELTEKIKNPPKTKLFMGTTIGICAAIGAIVVKNIINSKKKEGS